MNDLKHYLKKGWTHISKDYYNNIEHKKVAKERYSKSYRPELVLKILGSFREFYIDTLFKKFNKKRENYYLAFGSTNILSDYDITIVGPNACEIAKKIYESYLNEYKKTMAFSFDTNIYIAGFYYYSPKIINPMIKKNIITFKHKKYNITLFNFQPINSYQKEISLSYAFLKLLSISFDNPFFNEMKKKSKKLLKTLKKNKNIENSYKYMFKNAEELFSYLYHSKEKETKLDKIYELICKTQYYSIESYYTPCTVNVVVLTLQGKFKLNRLDPFNHICSIFENIGDLNYHWKHCDQLKNDFIKVSKYIYRIYYSLHELNIIKKSLKDISESISNRGNESLFKVEPFFEFIDYKPKSKSFNTFIKKIIQKVFELLLIDHQDLFL